MVNIKYFPNDINSKVSVNCDDGSKYDATHVVFTPSLGVLKANHQTLFTPALPDRKILEINSKGVGNLGKFFMEFESPFWEPIGKPFLGIEGL